MSHLHEMSPCPPDLSSLPEPPPRPLFRNPERYLECRQSPGLLGHLKARSEALALEQCLRAIGSIRSVCDVPCGPGRLFDLWSRHASRIMAFDLAGEMVSAASEAHDRLGLDGEVTLADAFDLDSHMIDRADLVVCIRFAYYFDRPARVALWRALANVSNRHVIIHFKVSGTLRGHLDSLRRALWGRRRKRTRRHPRHVIGRREIEQEVAMAGLRVVKFVRASQLSYSAYVLAERVDPVLSWSMGDLTLERAPRHAT